MRHWMSLSFFRSAVNEAPQMTGQISAVTAVATSRSAIWPNSPVVAVLLHLLSGSPCLLGAEIDWLIDWLHRFFFASLINYEAFSSCTPDPRGNHSLIAQSFLLGLRSFNWAILHLLRKKMQGRAYCWSIRWCCDDIFSGNLVIFVFVNFFDVQFFEQSSKISQRIILRQQRLRSYIHWTCLFYKKFYWLFNWSIDWLIADLVACLLDDNSYCRIAVIFGTLKSIPLTHGKRTGGHSFCTDYWRDYLTNKVTKGISSSKSACPAHKYQILLKEDFAMDILRDSKDARMSWKE